MEFFIYPYFIILCVFIPYLLTLRNFPYLEIMGAISLFISSQIKLCPHIIIDECHPITLIGIFIGFIGFLKFVLDLTCRKI